MKLNKFNYTNQNKTILIQNIQNKGPYFVSIFILILISWQLSKLFWLIFPINSTSEKIDLPSSMLTSSISVKSDANFSPHSVKGILKQNLFGSPNTVENMDQTFNQRTKNDIENINETQLSFSLKGTVAGNYDLNSYAIIADNSNEEKVYAINDSLTPGVTVSSVHEDRIIINNNNNLEALKLPKELVESMPLIIRDSRSNNRITRSKNSPQNDTSDLDFSEFGPKLADTIRPTPYLSDGRQLGFRVYPGNNRKQFMSLGLIPGDLITNINGESLQDTQKAIAIFQNLEKDTQVALTIIRNNSPQEIVIKSNQFISNN